MDLNNQINLNELEEWFDDVWEILVDIHISLNNLQRISEKKYDFEEKIKKHGFFIHHRYQLQFIAVIQLYKLVKDSEERSFFKLCNKLINHQYSVDLKSHLRKLSDSSPIVCKNKSELSFLCKEVKKILENEELIIKQIIDIRNEVFAHKSNSRTKLQINLTELKQLSNLLTNIFNELQFKIFFRESFFETPDWNIDYILFHCSESFKFDEQERIQKTNRI